MRSQDITEIVQAPLLKKLVFGVTKGNTERHPVKNAIAKNRVDILKAYLKIVLCLSLSSVE
jgi:hypothetical protein